MGVCSSGISSNRAIVKIPNNDDVKIPSFHDVKSINSKKKVIDNNNSNFGCINYENKQINLLKDLLIDPKMTLQKLITELIIILTVDLDLTVFGGAVMTKYSSIPTNDLDVAYSNIDNKHDFIEIFNIVTAKTKIKTKLKTKESTFKFMGKKEKIECYMLETCNGTKLKIDLISLHNLNDLPNDFNQASLIINKNGIYKRINIYQNPTLIIIMKK